LVDLLVHMTRKLQKFARPGEPAHPSAPRSGAPQRRGADDGAFTTAPGPVQ
jgi:hypothetical protein